MLVDCGHTFESDDIERWMEMGDEIMAKSCPRCRTPIANTQRFSEYIKRGMVDIIKVKEKSIGNNEENRKRLVTLLLKMERQRQRQSSEYLQNLVTIAIDIINFIQYNFACQKYLQIFPVICHKLVRQVPQN